MSVGQKNIFYFLLFTFSLMVGWWRKSGEAGGRAIGRHVGDAEGPTDERASSDGGRHALAATVAGMLRRRGGMGRQPGWRQRRRRDGRWWHHGRWWWQHGGIRQWLDAVATIGWVATLLYGVNWGVFLWPSNFVFVKGDLPDHIFWFNSTYTIFLT